MSIVRRMMTEADAIAARLGVEQMPISIDERIAAARNAGAHKMSMLQDLERGRPLEIDVLVDSIAAMRELAQLATTDDRRCLRVAGDSDATAAITRPSPSPAEYSWISN
jgi:2-dehydropantoate 2-reductase